jgi:hypothetical protein
LARRNSTKSKPSSVDPETQKLVRPDGLSVRRRRHDHGWSPRDLVTAIEMASFDASGLRRTLTPNLLKAIEEQSEAIPYDQLLLLADGLGCDPVDLIAEGEFSTRRAARLIN